MEPTQIRQKMKGLAGETIGHLSDAYEIARDRRQFTRNNYKGRYFTPVMKDKLFLTAVSELAKKCGLSRVLVDDLIEMRDLCR